MNTPLIIPLLLVGFLAGEDRDDVTDSDRVELTASWGKISHSSHDRHLDPQWADVLQPGPAIPRAEYAWNDFERLVPQEGTEVGDVFELPFDAVRPFLEQIQPHPRETSHMAELPHPPDMVPTGMFGYPGVHGVLLERSEDRIDILLRAHVEFELQLEKVYFTVSQLEGRLIADLNQKRVIAFRLEVPSRTYNYDVHIRDGEGFLIDIGCVEDVGVRGGSVEALAPEPSTIEAARTALKRAFYPFARLDWLDFEEGFEASREQNKPLHLVAIFGPLDDESC